MWLRESEREKTKLKVKGRYEKKQRKWTEKDEQNISVPCIIFILSVFIVLLYWQSKRQPTHGNPSLFQTIDTFSRLMRNPWFPVASPSLHSCFWFNLLLLLVLLPQYISREWNQTTFLYRCILVPQFCFVFLLNLPRNKCKFSHVEASNCSLFQCSRFKKRFRFLKAHSPQSLKKCNNISRIGFLFFRRYC